MHWKTVISTVFVKSSNSFFSLIISFIGKFVQNINSLDNNHMISDKMMAHTKQPREGKYYYKASLL